MAPLRGGPHAALAVAADGLGGGPPLVSFPDALRRNSPRLSSAPRHGTPAVAISSLKGYEAARRVNARLAEAACPGLSKGGNSARGLLGRLRSSAVSPRRSTGRINSTWSDEVPAGWRADSRAQV
jgi:hypothetical protein